MLIQSLPPSQTTKIVEHNGSASRALTLEQNRLLKIKFVTKFEIEVIKSPKSPIHMFLESMENKSNLIERSSSS